MTHKWHKIYKKYGLHSLPKLDKTVEILIDKDTIYKAKLVMEDIPCMTLDEQLYWEIENLGNFCLIEPDFWRNIEL